MNLRSLCGDDLNILLVLSITCCVRGGLKDGV